MQCVATRKISVPPDGSLAHWVPYRDQKNGDPKLKQPLNASSQSQDVEQKWKELKRRKVERRISMHWTFSR